MTHMLIGGAEAEIDINAIPHDDKLAYAWGFMQGLGGEKREKPQDREGLAEGYKEGHAHGLRVRGLDKRMKPLPVPDPAPAWAKVNWKTVRKT
jgi:hypothetical protein